MACCFKLAESVTTEVLKSCIVDRVNRVYSLIKNYGSNLNQLQDIHLQLRAKKDDIAGKVENGESKLEQVANEARDWLQSVEKLLEDEQVKDHMNEDYKRAKDQCCFGLILCNLYQRYGISRSAEAKVDEMQGKLTQRPQDPVTVPTRTLDLEPMDTRHCNALKTREGVEQRILEMLKDDQVDAVGICGMGGIGKKVPQSSDAHKMKSVEEVQGVAPLTLSNGDSGTSSTNPSVLGGKAGDANTKKQPADARAPTFSMESPVKLDDSSKRS